MMIQEKQSSHSSDSIAKVIGIVVVVVIAGAAVLLSILNFDTFGAATNEGFCSELRRNPPMVLIDRAADLGEGVPSSQVGASYAIISRERISEQASEALDHVSEVAALVATKGHDPAIAKQQIADDDRLLKEEYAKSCMS